MDTKNKTKKQKQVSNYVSAEKEILKFVGKSLGVQEQAMEKIKSKYEVTKTVLRTILKNAELEIKKEALEKKKEEEEKLKATRRLEKEKKKEEEEKLKATRRLEKEKKKREKELEEATQKELKKEMLDRLELEWATCEDELFQNVFEADPRKAQHYFTKRLMSENTYLSFEDNGEILMYCPEGEDEGIYIQNADKLISSEVEKRLGEKATIFPVREIISKIQRTQRVDREIILRQSKNLIPVKNGLLNIDTLELSSFTPEHIYLCKLNAEFNPEKDCPKFKKYLETSLPRKEATHKTIQEFAGLTISNDTSHQVAFISHGKGASGQSVVQEVIQAFLGDRNVSNLSVQQIESDKFAAVRLFGKKANMNPDLPKKALSESSKIKKVIASERIDVEKKGKDGYSLRPTCKLWFGCNQIPSNDDHSDAFYRRWIVAKFEEQFLKGDPRRIEDLHKIISSDPDEMSGILNWALEGYCRLSKQGKFTENLSIQEVKDFWLENSDTPSSFFKKHIRLEDGMEILKQDVYDTYTIYCSNLQKEPAEQNVFFRRLKTLCDYREKTPSVNATDRRRILIGLNIIPLKQGGIE